MTETEIQLSNRVKQLNGKVADLLRVTQLVRNLHQGVPVGAKTLCSHCQVSMPCPTTMALKGQRH